MSKVNLNISGGNGVKTVKIALLIVVFVLSPSIGLALPDSTDENQERFITIYIGDEQPAVSSEEREDVHELFTDAELYVEQAEDEVEQAEDEVEQAEDELDPTIIRSRYVRVNFDYLKESESIVLNLFNDVNDVSVTAVRDRIEKRSESRYTWFGQVPGRGYTSVILTVENGDMAGYISINEELYHVRPLGNGIHVVRELDPCAFPPDAPALVPPPDPYPDTNTVPGAQYNAVPELQCDDDGSTIDVMVVYTDDVARASGNIVAEIQSAIDQTNNTYKNSGIVQRLRLVHTAELNYAETGDAYTDLDCITYGSDSCLEQIHNLRDEYHADVVSFWVLYMADWCGLGWVMTDPNSWFQSRAFTVVKRSCATSNYTFAHELGHNMGAGHDVHAPSHSGAFPYSHGYTWDAWLGLDHFALRSIMAYQNWCADHWEIYSCPKIGYWSNPNIYFRVCAEPFDWPCTDYYPFGYVDTVDNHRTLNETAYIVANFRQSNPPPVCDADGPYVAECGGATTEITLDGTGSSDPDDDLLAYSWTSDCSGAYFDDNTSPTPTLMLNTSNGCNVICNVILTVTDEAGCSDMCETTVTIQDTMPPDIICPDDSTIECDESSDPGNTGESIATDDCDPNPIINFSDVVTPGDCPNEETITRTWTATDYCGNSRSCVQTIDVVDTTKPNCECNTPATGTITPPDAPISFTATATDNCDDNPLVEILGYDCYFYTKKGKRIDKTESGVVEIEGDTISILDSGGVGTYINWTVLVTDDCGNETEMECEVEVINPGKPTVPHDQRRHRDRYRERTGERNTEGL
jgi:hypothetical protein